MANADVEVFKVWPTFSDQKPFIEVMTADKLITLQTRDPAHFKVHRLKLFEGRINSS